MIVSTTVIKKQILLPDYYDNFTSLSGADDVFVVSIGDYQNGYSALKLLEPSVHKYLVKALLFDGCTRKINIEHFLFILHDTRDTREKLSKKYDNFSIVEKSNNKITEENITDICSKFSIKFIISAKIGRQGREFNGHRPVKYTFFSEFRNLISITA